MDSDLWTTRLLAASRRYQSRSVQLTKEVMSMVMMSRGRSFFARSVPRNSTLSDFAAMSMKPILLKLRMGYGFGFDLVECPSACGDALQNMSSNFFKWFHEDLCCSLTRSYVQRKRRFRKGGSNLTISTLRKELRERNIQSLLGGFQSLVSSSSTEPDPLLSSFMYNLPVVDEPARVKPKSSVEASSVKESSIEDSSKRFENWH
ncbi:hypothetical protein TEA_021263 [Camellia sinensis var. sinensis]|uniref:Di19 C-terminal domain-containing protein n=1 Tax=Camellia sinensis var. sinensis TaxID=542762 RepID=A0A4S4D4U4_CAMSN|nr:hypothetical protein TEA_021263 [Camellia sinensis var. sinensis]